MSLRSVTVNGVDVPRLLYGTAWKEDRTAPLTRAAIEAGFRGIDTANQRRHYHEAAVGQAIQAALEAGVVRRKDLFLQTKFTYVDGQDHRLPYDPKAPLEAQVEQSLASSLQHLGVDALDSYLLHGPSSSHGLRDEDRRVWKAMEALQRAAKVRMIGVSNIGHDQLEELYGIADVKPALVQNRTFTRPASDQAVRAFCAEHGMGYEGFSLLTAHRGLFQHPLIVDVAARSGLTPAQTVLRFCLDRGMIVLTGTTSAEHMRQDLAILEHPLAPDDVKALAGLLG